MMHTSSRSHNVSLSMPMPEVATELTLTLRVVCRLDATNRLLVGPVSENMSWGMGYSQC